MKRGSVEWQFDGERFSGVYVANLPAEGLLAGELDRSPRAGGERFIELELSRRVVPVSDVGPPVPRERGTHGGFDGMLRLIGDVIHDGCSPGNRDPLFVSWAIAWPTTP